MKTQRSTYLNFIAQANARDTGPKATITTCVGSDPYTIGLVKAGLVRGWGSDKNSLAIESEQLNQASFVDTFSQSSMFEPQTLFTVALQGCNQSLIQTLAQLGSTATSNKLLLTLTSKPSAKLAKLMRSSERFELITCPEPAPFEFVDFTHFAATEAGIKLDSSAAKLVVECLGRDPSLIANELNRLSLIFDQHPGVISSAILAPHLGLLKEDMVFRLRNYFFENRTGLASALLYSLIERGESPLAVLGFLSKHVRTAICVADCVKTNQNPNDIARRAGLQKYLVTSYTNYVRRVDLKQLSSALRLCILADRKFKSERVDGYLMLSQILQNL